MTHRARRLIALVAGTLLLLGGCATRSDLADGQALIAQGRLGEGLAMLEAAAKARPKNVEALTIYTTQREAIVNATVREGDAYRLAGDLDAAAARYRVALGFDPLSASAKAGLDSVSRMRRLDAAATEAQVLLGRGDIEGADRLARQVLAEDSTQRAARLVVRSVAEQRARTETTEPRLMAAMGRRISLELRDASLRSVFAILAQSGGINFVMDKDVKVDQKTTIFVRDSSLEDTIKILLLTNQLDRKVLNDNSMLIYPATPAKQREFQELSVRSFYLANADVKQTAAMIRALVKTRDIFVDEKLNLLVMRDTNDAIRLAEKLVATQDLGEPEVVLELEVLEVASSLIEEIGVKYPDSIIAGVPGVNFNGQPNFPPLAQIGSGAGLRAYVANPVLVLNLRKQDGTTNILANPRIRVKNREKARVHIGERVPVVTSTISANVGVTSSVSYLDTGLKLDVEPNIYLENEVAIKVQLEVSNILEQITFQDTVAYRLGTRNAATTLRLQDGETQVLAGLISSDERKTYSKLPFAGDLPVVGPLFRSKDERGNKSEIVLLITPHIVRNLARPDSVAVQFLSGTDVSPGTPPLRLSATSARGLSVEAVGTSASVAAPTAAAAPPGATVAPLALTVGGPAEVTIGEEFDIALSLPAGAAGDAVSVDVAYDTVALQLVGNDSEDAGKVQLKVAAPAVAGLPNVPTSVRFKVVAKTPTQTLLSFDTSRSSVPVRPPGALALNIVSK